MKAVRPNAEAEEEIRAAIVWYEKQDERHSGDAIDCLIKPGKYPLRTVGRHEKGDRTVPDDRVDENDCDCGDLHPHGCIGFEETANTLPK